MRWLGVSGERTHNPSIRISERITIPQAFGPLTAYRSPCSTTHLRCDRGRNLRLWSLHPKYLDARGLVALWREALLAKAVLQGKTRGYRHHPQLERWRACRDPVAGLNAYLTGIYLEAERRGYHFDRRKLGRRRGAVRIRVTRGQVEREWAHLMRKLQLRDPMRYRELHRVQRPLSHPLIRIVPGPVAGWERIG